MTQKAYNGSYRQSISVIISCDNHQDCLQVAKIIKQQCDVWAFSNVRYKEHKSARKGDVLEREVMISQKAYADDIIIFKEAIRRICEHYGWLFMYSNNSVRFIDKGAVPEKSLQGPQKE
ncbi:MAG: hypothetical protein LAT54_10560 [Cryomorphaceae bacterium]|nr:hypothetical protein [Cryomorphaceae bacterium]